MFSYHERLTVLGVSHVSLLQTFPKDANPARSDAYNNLRALRGIFAAPNAPTREDRAHKRRKLNGVGNTSAEEATFDHTRSVVLFKVLLDLVGRPSSCNQGELTSLRM